MKHRLKFPSILAAALVVSLFAAVACGDDGEVVDQTPTTNPQELIGRALPDVTGENLTGTGEAQLSSFEGRPMVVSIWLNACPDCQRVMPQIQAIADRLTSVKFVSVAIDEKGANGSGPKGYETPKAFATTAKLTMPSILAPRATVDRAFHLYRIPTVFLADSSGTITAVFVWPFTTAELETAAAALR
jgi:thiol-disulfide isomerase/thioredoxin